MDESMDDYSNSLFVFDAIGIHWEIETFEPLNDAVKKKVLDRIELFDQTYSGYSTDSPVAKAACTSEGSSLVLPDDFIRTFELYDRIYHLIGGKDASLVGQGPEQSGQYKNYALLPATDIQQAVPYDWQQLYREADSVRNRQTLVNERPVVIDIGAAVKSYLVDVVSDVLFKQQVNEFIINAGEDVRHAGGWPFPVGLEHPLKPNRIIGIVDLQDNAICTVGSTNKWASNTSNKGMHHPPDAATELPVHDVIATWVVAKNALTAHWLATALFYTGTDKLNDHFPFSSVRMFSDNTIEKSKNFKGELFEV